MIIQPGTVYDGINREWYLRGGVIETDKVTFSGNYSQGDGYLQMPHQGDANLLLNFTVEPTQKFMVIQVSSAQYNVTNYLLRFTITGTSHVTTTPLWYKQDGTTFITGNSVTAASIFNTPTWLRINYNYQTTTHSVWGLREYFGVWRIYNIYFTDNTVF